MSSYSGNYWKQLAPRPFSSLWIWCAHRSLKNQPHVFFSPHNIVSHDEDDDYSDDDSHGPLNYFDYDGDSEGSTDWLDSTLASLDQIYLSPSECIIKSIPVNSGHRNSSSTDVDGNQILSETKSKRRIPKRSDNKRRKVEADNRDNSKQAPASEQEVSTLSQEQEDILESQAMKILDVNESHSIIVLKKSPVKYFSIIYGDAKLTTIVGSMICDGYTLNPEESAHISTGFGSYQICINPLKFQRYPSKDHLAEVLDSFGISESLKEKIFDYLVNRDSSMAESLIFSLEKWRWPALTALRLFINPEVEFSHWFQLSFSETKSPVGQWSRMLERLSDDITQKTRAGLDRPLSPIKGKSTRGVRIVLLGGCNSGKSSLTRHLSNRIISSVTDKLFLFDCDPGQSEFSSPGIVNSICVKEPILSPPFVNCLRFNKDILASCSIAGIGIQNNPDLYIAAIKHLWKTFLLSLPDADIDKPIIVNTIGWTQGLGINLMVDVLRIFQPTHVIEIKRPPYDGKDNFPFNCNPATVNQLDGWSLKPDFGGPPNMPENSQCSLKPYLNYDYIRIYNEFAPKRCSRQARTNRVNNQLAYFCLMDEILFKSFYELEVITLDLKNLYFHVQYEFPIDKQLIPHVIKDSWVHLCSIDEPNLPQNDQYSPKDQSLLEQNRPSTSTYQDNSIGKIYPMSNESAVTCQDLSDSAGTSSTKFASSVPPGFSQLNPNAKPFWGIEPKVNLKILPFLRENKYLGSAIVRDIDLVNDKLIIITPESPEKIAQVNCIVRPQGIFVPDPLQLGNH
ncbi:uncharacterized protein LOC107366527 [Tetranychus urticae]|uniref:Clp1 P-loop domain-containing protein n=1 Tax=Tetranychus urticae TaxID=32264 RepID=T1KQL9_TETUR|nr:uncharacterized protein LOC107366527 [Tetranychus urticae]